MKNNTLFTSTAVLFSLLTSCSDNRKDVSLPNIIIIFTDDQGYGDVGIFGAIGFETPHLDRMASQGMTFTNFYSGYHSSSPSRASLLTGCYPSRVSITNVLFPHDNIGLNSEETTIAELLKQKNYATAIIGKWHLGHHYEFLPLHHGFDEYFGLPYSNDMWPVHYDGTPVTRENAVREWKLNCPPLPLIEGNEKIEEISTLEDQDMLTTRYTERAVDFIKRNRKNPFFIYLPHSMPHVPLGVSDKFRGKSEQGFYGDVMMEIDWSVGEIFKALKKYGIDKNTLVIFTSDNGPWLMYGNHGGSAGGLREAKGSIYEGGFKVPGIMKWPDVIPAGTICNRIVAAIDIFPTLAEITGVDLPENKIDGISVLPLLQGNFEVNPRREYYFVSGKSIQAVRKDNWKYVFPHRIWPNAAVTGNDGWPPTGNSIYIDSVIMSQGELFDIRRDPGERYNVKELYPEIVRELEMLTDKMRKELGDESLGIAGSGIRPPGKVNAK